jgi:hypothetical protein
MAAITWPNVVDFAPELSAFDADAQTPILAYVNDEAFHLDSWGGEDSSTLRLGRIYLAAHMATISNSGGSAVAGPVTSETAGGLSRSYGFMSSVEADPLLDATPYGRLFRELLRRTPARSALLL